MAWYNKYLSLSEHDHSLYQEISTKLRQKRKDQIDVSIVLIAHNEEKRILSCIYSLADQTTNLSYELIVVNNASTDGTQHILDRLSSLNSIIENKKGHGFARQAGLDVAKGKYHLCADSDTLYPPGFLDTMVKPLIHSEKISATYSFCGFIKNGFKKRISVGLYELFRDLFVCFQSVNRPELAVRGMSFAFRTDQAKMIGWKTNIRRGEDGAMAVGLKQFGKMKLILNPWARVKTSPRTLDADGNIFNIIRVRIKKEGAGIGEYFYKKTSYDDRDSNLLK